MEQRLEILLELAAELLAAEKFHAVPEMEHKLAQVEHALVKHVQDAYPRPPAP
jgi:hypothetical protein